MKNIIVIVLLLSGLACGNYDRSGDSISSGTLKLGVDISYRLMMESEIDVFQEFYSDAKVAIGVISVSWLSDREDATAKAIRGKVKTIGVINDKTKYQSKMARGPYQAYIYDQSYPYRRDVYAIRTGLKETVGTGFVSFLAGEKGQLIIHKMGMVAAKSPVRTIKIKQ